MDTNAPDRTGQALTTDRADLQGQLIQQLYELTVERDGDDAEQARMLFQHLSAGGS